MKYATEERSCKQLAASIPKRGLELCVKLLGIKGAVFVVATVLLAMGRIESWMWLIAAAGVIGGSFGQKLIDKARS